MYTVGRARSQADVPALGSLNGGWGRTKVSYMRESLEFPLLGNESDGQLGVLQTLYQGDH